MKAARLVGPRQFEILDVPTPELKPNEVLVKMETMSICGSDLLTYDRVMPEEDYPWRIGLPCHECCGVIEESFDSHLESILHMTRSKPETVSALLKGWLSEDS